VSLALEQATTSERKTMRTFIRSKAAHAKRPRRLAISAVVAAAAVAAGLAAGPASAAADGATAEASQRLSHNALPRPKLKRGELRVTGTNASDTIALRLRAGDPGMLEVDAGDDGSADFAFPRSEIARIAVSARPGNDLVRIDEANGVFTDQIATTLAGGRGNDTLLGGRGVETLLGELGNDSIDGNAGNDVALMGAGYDTFTWDPGDGSDVIEGQSGFDRMVFNGAGAAERIDISANGERLRFFRDLGNITMDTDSVERVDFNALGGADVVTVNDLSATDVYKLNVDLAAALGGAAGDGQADSVVVNATNGNDAIDVDGNAGSVDVRGLAPRIAILHAEAASDRLEINTLAGTDTVDSTGLAPGVIQLFVDGVLVP
jgi:Ca2+-binding RTX toxin-like protein